MNHPWTKVLKAVTPNEVTEVSTDRPRDWALELPHLKGEGDEDLAEETSRCWWGERKGDGGWAANRLNASQVLPTGERSANRCIGRGGAGRLSQVHVWRGKGQDSLWLKRQREERHWRQRMELTRKVSRKRRQKNQVVAGEKREVKRLFFLMGKIRAWLYGDAKDP